MLREIEDFPLKFTLVFCRGSKSFAVSYQKLHQVSLIWSLHLVILFRIVYLLEGPRRSWENVRRPRRFRAPSKWHFEGRPQNWRYFPGPNAERRFGLKSPNWMGADFSRLYWRWENLQNQKRFITISLFNRNTFATVIYQVFLGPGNSMQGKTDLKFTLFWIACPSQGKKINFRCAKVTEKNLLFISFPWQKKIVSRQCCKCWRSSMKWLRKVQTW